MPYGSSDDRVNAYKQTKVRTASQGQMILMLYDEAMKQIDIASTLLAEETQQLDRVHNAIIRAQAAITELMVGLDLDQGGDVAQNLLSIYLYVNGQLTEGNLNKDRSYLLPVRRMLSDLRGAWHQVVNKQPGQSGESSSGGGVNVAG